MEPTVSICIPASRDSDDLSGAIASVLDQGMDDLEVVVSDDSGGSLRQAAEAFADPRVRYLANERPLGFADNHTTSMARARGRFIGILHDDDRLLPGYLDAVLAPFEGDPDLGFVFVDMSIDRGDGPPRPRGVPVAAGRHEDFLRPLVEHDFMVPSTTLMRREVWDRGKQTWPDIVVADLTMYVDAALAGWAYHYVDRPLVLYRMHEGQVGADAEKHRGGLVTLWEGYRFDEHPEAEKARRDKLAWSLIGLAGVCLKSGRGAEARRHLARAKELAPRKMRVKRGALGLLARGPFFGPLAGRVWRRLRPDD